MFGAQGKVAGFANTANTLKAMQHGIVTWPVVDVCFQVFGAIYKGILGLGPKQVRDENGNIKDVGRGYELASLFEKGGDKLIRSAIQAPTTGMWMGPFVAAFGVQRAVGGAAGQQFATKGAIGRIGALVGQEGGMVEKLGVGGVAGFKFVCGQW